MEQEQLRRSGKSGLAVEDVRAINGDAAILDGGHEGVPSGKEI
jgi:hypothetical protein